VDHIALFFDRTKVLALLFQDADSGAELTRSLLQKSMQVRRRAER
jgi:hypothetical protein